MRIVILFFMIINHLNILHGQYYHIKNNKQYNPINGYVRAVYNCDTFIEGGDAKEKVENYLLQNSSIFGYESGMGDLKFIKQNESHGIKHFLFKQYYNDIEVINSNIVISVNQNNKICMIISDYHPKIKISENPLLAISFVEKNAINAFDEYKNVNEIKVSDKKIYVDENNLAHWVYEVEIGLNNLPLGMVLVDGINGNIIEKNFYGLKYTGSGTVFEPDPGSYLRDSTLTYLSDVSSAYQNGKALTNLNSPNYLRGAYAYSNESLQPPSTEITSSDGNFNFTNDQAGFNSTNIYYFITYYRNWLNTLSISPLWHEDEQSMIFDGNVNIPQFSNNAIYYPQSQYEYILFASIPNTIRPSQDLSVIIHEYGHALHDALISGGFNYLTSGSDSERISEGIGDYLAISFRRTLQSNPFRPNRRSNYFRDDSRFGIKPVSQANYNLWGQGDSYFNGAIWASTIMDLEYNDGTNPSSGTNLGRNITTKLLLKSLSYIPVTANAIDYVNAIMQADRDLYNGSHLFTIEQVFRNRGFFEDYEVSGTISSNTTWTDYRLVTGNVTVASGVTLTILPNTFIYFDSGKYLSVNGNINATSSMFTSSSSSTYWGGVVFNSGSQGNLDGCTINRVQTYGGGAIVISNASPTIQNCTIENNVGATSGIQILSNGSPYIYNNIIRNNTYHGILIEHANGYLRYNMITSSTNNMASVYCNNFANPLFGGVGGGLSEGKNTLQNGYYGLYANYYSMPSAGASDIAYNNRFINNSYANAYASNNSSIHARYDWWGQTPPDQNKIIAVSGSNIYWDQYLQNDPGPSRSIHFIPQNYNKSLPYYSVQSINVPPLLEARELRFNKQYEQAISIYKTIIADRSNLENVKIALVEIGNTYKECNDSTLIDYLNDIGITKDYNLSLRPLVLSVLENIYSYSGNINKAIDFNNVIIRDYPETDHAYYAHLNLSFLYYNKEEYDKAQSVINEFNSKYSLADHYQPIEWLLGIKTDNKNRLLGDFSLNQKVNKKTVEKVILFENYPNPFNPSTKISFTLTSKENVKLKVFDILGREVALLIDKELETGKHEIEFDASELPSGVYFYNLTTPTNSFTKKMLLIK